MDVLADLMNLIRIKGSIYGHLEFSAPFGFNLQGADGICLIVTRGSCYLGVNGDSPISLTGGDFVLLTSPASYTLRSSFDLPLRDLLEITSAEDFFSSRVISFDGGQGPSTSIVAGCFTLAWPESTMLVKHLPPVIHLQSAENQTMPWFQSTLQFIDAEVRQNLPGGTAIVDRLAEVLFVHAMRSRINSSSGQGQSWLCALNDPKIGEAIRLMHKEPERQWTVSDLADHVSMSRSAFADRFRKLTGETPLGKV